MTPKFRLYMFSSFAILISFMAVITIITNNWFGFELNSILLIYYFIQINGAINDIKNERKKLADNIQLYFIFEEEE